MKETSTTTPTPAGLVADVAAFRQRLIDHGAPAGEIDRVVDAYEDWARRDATRRHNRAQVTR